MEDIRKICDVIKELAKSDGAAIHKIGMENNIFQMRVYEAFLCYHWLVFDEMRKIYGYNSDVFLETVMGGNDK